PRCSWRRRFVWFYLDASPDQTNRTRQNESRRKDESRRIKMNRTLQDESRRIKMNRTLQDESRRNQQDRGLTMFSSVVTSRSPPVPLPLPLPDWFFRRAGQHPTGPVRCGSNRQGHGQGGHCGRLVAAFWPKSGEMRTNSHEFTSEAPS